MQNRPAAGRNTLYFSLLECLVISKSTNRAQKVRHTYSCCLPRSLPFVPKVHSFFFCSESLFTLGSRAMLIMLDSTGELLVVTQMLLVVTQM